MTNLLSILLSGSLIIGGQQGASSPGIFAYSIEKTPEEGPVDSAVTSRYTQHFHACTSGRSATSVLVPCFEQEFTRQDMLLNRAWLTAMRRVPAARRSALRAAERQWIVARDPFCKRFVGGLRGSLVSVAYLDCRIELTVRRTLWLERL
jgi:uncharacterized protein YecT (DUF1311 family)